MKRIIGIILAMCLILSSLAFFASCKDQETGKVVVWHDKEEQVISVLKEEVAKLGLAREVEFVRKESLTDSLKLVGNDPKSAPDMFIFAHDKAGLFAELGILMPISELELEISFEDFLPVTIEASTYGGVQYQLPLYFETLLFMYNKALLSKEDVPKTTEELYTLMKEGTVKSQKKFPFVEQHSTAYYSAPWIQGFGGKILSSDGNAAIDSKEVVDALTYHKKFLEFMPGEGEYSTINTLFFESLASSIIGGPWLVPTARERGIDLGFAPMPTIDQTGEPLSPFLGVQGIYVLKHVAKNEGKLADIKRVLTALMDKDVSTAIAIESGCAPSQNSCYLDERIKADLMVNQMRETALKAQPMPNLPQMDVMFNVLGKLLEDVNLKNKDPQESCTVWQGKAEKLIKAMK